MSENYKITFMSFTFRISTTFYNMLFCIFFL